MQSQQSLFVTPKIVYNNNQLSQRQAAVTSSNKVTVRNSVPIMRAQNVILPKSLGQAPVQKELAPASSNNWFNKLMTPAPTATSRVQAPKMKMPEPVGVNLRDQARTAFMGSVVATAMFSNTQAVSAASIADGAKIFDANCSACHAGGQNVIQAEKTLQKDALTEYLAGGLKESSIITQVTNGKNAMPAFGGKLSDEDIQNVAAYVYD